MAFKLSKQDIKDRDELVAAAQSKLVVLNEAIEKYNGEMADCWSELEEAVNDYNGALADARDFAERIYDEFTEEYDNKSEKWQEGDRGSAARDWIDTFNQVVIEDAEIDEPDPLAEVAAGGLDELQALETEAAS